MSSACMCHTDDLCVWCEQGNEINRLRETLLTVDNLAKQARMHWLQDEPSLVLLRINLIVEEIKEIKK